MDNLQNHLAEELAKDFESGDVQKTGSKLQEQFLLLNNDRNLFISELKATREIIDKDSVSNEYLPNLDVKETRDWLSGQSDLRVSMTRPGKIFENAWRTSEEVFADLRSGQPNFGGGPSIGGFGSRSEYAVAEKGSVVECYGNSHVVAEDGSIIEATMRTSVTAEKGSFVRVLPASTLNELVNIYGKFGSTIETSGNTRIKLEPGARLITNTPHTEMKKVEIIQ